MGVDTAGKTSSMWEIYAISPPHGSDIEEAGSRSERVFTDTPEQKRSECVHIDCAGTLQTPAKVEENFSRQCRASLSGPGACGKYSEVQFQQSFQPYLMAFFSA